MPDLLTEDVFNPNEVKFHSGIDFTHWPLDAFGPPSFQLNGNEVFGVVETDLVVADSGPPPLASGEIITMKDITVNNLFSH